MIKKMLLAAAVTAVTLATTAASAATITISGISGTWDNVIGGGTSVTGVNTSDLRWGDPATVNGKSGYDFDAAATPIVDPLSPFFVGDFTHLNWPIYAPSISGADLTVNLVGDVDGSAFSISGTYTFAHVETPNNDDPCAEGGVAPCRDKVTLVGNSTASDALVVDGVGYFFDLIGFTGGVDFYTAEGQTNTASLYGAFTTTPGIDIDPIPLPAGGLLMVTGIGALGLMRRKRKNAS